jgi:hypothetical protein
MRGYMRFLSRTLIYRGNAAILENRAYLERVSKKNNNSIQRF